MKDIGAGSLSNGFAFEFKLDAAGRVFRVAKDGVNAGVASILAYYPTIDTTVVLLANIDYDLWAMHREFEPLLSG